MRNKTNSLIASSLIGLSLAFPVIAEEKQAEAADELVAIVNGTDLKRGTLDAVIEMAKRSRPGAQIDEKALLDDLIATEIARQEAKKSGLGEREDVKAKVENFADKLILNTWMQEKAGSLEISDEDIKAVYDERIKDMPKTEYKARHILVKTEEEGKALVKELADGKDFAELAKEKSTGPSGPKGGDLGWFKPQSMVKPFSEAVVAMKAGDVSPAPVETQFGWHVIKLEEQRDVKLPELDSMKPQLKRQLEQKEMLEYMEKLRADADVKVLMKEKAAEAPKADEKEDKEEAGEEEKSDS
ncbi:MAG: Peptidylprolyl isomerase [uncultured Thiotrichaceae bacterium]|uniref:peptidylprolyl isomerase n=1 Tax=uncultured Thiotrichaceae bacterium TaxID=298394 RepID=A0A6S6SLR5_9GAMM|nr:MAG: Peptidylprolyl isomerase [uncultured Thiotrichaceae bacterium]